jgi:hypothetical protein
MSKTKTTKKVINNLPNEPIIEELDTELTMTIEPKKKFNSKEYYQKNKDKIKARYIEKKKLKEQLKEQLKKESSDDESQLIDPDYCYICKCSFSHKAKHYASDKHTLREIIQKQYDLNESLIKILKKTLNNEEELETQDLNDDKKEGEFSFSFDDVYCYKI